MSSIPTRTNQYKFKLDRIAFGILSAEVLLAVWNVATTGYDARQRSAMDGARLAWRAKRSDAMLFSKHFTAKGTKKTTEWLMPTFV